MRKIVFALMVLMVTTGAWAAVDVNCNCDADTNVVTIRYVNGEPNRVRAFALDVNVAGANIVGVSNLNADYYVYPGSIEIDSGGNVTDDGNAVCDSAYPGTNPGLGTDAVTIEMGSLYAASDPDHNTPPGNSGILLKLQLSGKGNVSIAKNTIRGGVVMENPGLSPTVNTTGCGFAPPECFPSDHPDYAMWSRAYVGKPDCWCYTYQCKGDTDNVFEGKDNPGKRKYVVLADLQLLSSGWQKVETDPDFSSFICADFDHNFEGKDNPGKRKHVVLTDLQILSAHWQKVDTDPCMVDNPCFP